MHNFSTLFWYKTLHVSDRLVYTTTHCSLKAYCAILVRCSQLLSPGVSTRITTREHPAAEGGTVGEKCPEILSKFRNPRYIYGT